MKTYKTLFLAVGLTLSSLIFISLGNPKASAASYTRPDIEKCVSTLRMVDLAHLTCLDSSNNAINFVDSAPEDTTANYVPVNASAFCSPDLSAIDHFVYFSPKSLNTYGINFELGKDSSGNQIYTYNLSGNAVGFINLGYNSGDGCVAYATGTAAKPGDPASSINVGPNNVMLQWNPDGSNSIISLVGVTDPSQLSGYNFERFKDTSLDPGNGSLLYVGSNVSVAAGNCSGNVLLLNGIKSVVYSLTKDSGGSNYPELKNLMGSSGCLVKNINFNLYSPGGATQLATVYVTGTPSTKPGTGDINGGTSGGTTGGGVDGTKTCDAHFSNPFSWIICPVMDLADSAAGQFSDFVDQQLCFSTGDTNKSSTGNVSCNSSDNLTSQVHDAWNIFKNIASAVLVIILLVAVISQAIGGGPFDAYTIRKILPRIVVAVILMQLSWVLLKWFIDLSNDAGNSINSLMLAPFGGTDHITLGGLTGGYDLSGTNPAASAGLAAFTFFGALAALAIVSVPGLLLMVLYVILALLTAFITLLLRKMLIILLVILAPVAFVMWILPGTDKYWKMWKDNFSKLLIMFPMIMGMIAGGKIFAYISSSSTSSTIFHPHLSVMHLGSLPIPYFGGALTSFVQLAIILGAWFMPYFMLPQTFRWGGSALGSLSKGVANATNKASDPARGYLKWRQGLSPWKQARAARRSEQEKRAKIGFAENLQAGGALGRVRRARLAGVPTGFNRKKDAGIRSTITEHASAALEADMQSQVKKENVDHINGYLASSTHDDESRTRVTQEATAFRNGRLLQINADRRRKGLSDLVVDDDRVAAAAQRSNDGRVMLGLDEIGDTEISEMSTNFSRFDTNGWGNNRIFATAAIQAAGQAGSLTRDAERAAQAIYVGDRTGHEREEANARFGAIRFQAHGAARSAGQYASDQASLGLVMEDTISPTAVLPNGQPHPLRGLPNPDYDPLRTGAEWRRVADASQVGVSSIPNYIGGSNPNTGVGHAIEVATNSGQFNPAAIYEFRDPSGNIISYTGIGFNDAGIQTFMKEAARIQSGQRNLSGAAKTAWDREYSRLMARLDPAVRPQLERTISEMAGRRQFIDPRI